VAGKVGLAAMKNVKSAGKDFVGPSLFMRTRSKWRKLRRLRPFRWYWAQAEVSPAAW